MNPSAAIQYVLFLGIVTALVKPLGGYLEKVFSRKRSALDGLCGPVEQLLYRVCVGRFAVAVPALVFAGFFARQKKTPASAGTLPTDSVTFGVLVIACLLILTALSYLPVLALGPVLERLQFGT